MNLHFSRHTPFFFRLFLSFPYGVQSTTSKRVGVNTVEMNVCRQPVDVKLLPIGENFQK